MTRQEILLRPVYLTAPPSKTEPRQRWLYILLWFIAGPLGIHSFYRRCPLQGMLQMLTGPLFVIWIFIGPSILAAYTTVIEHDRQFVLSLLPIGVWCAWLLTDLFMDKDGNGIPLD